MEQYPQDQQAPLNDQEQLPQEAPGGAPQEGQSQSLRERIEPSIREQMNPQQIQDMDRVLDYGMEMIFGKETASKLFDSIRPEDEIPIEDELGSAAVNMMLIMVKKSGNSMPGEVVIPAGTILLATSVDYINESGIAQVSDEQFGSALEMFVDVIQEKLNPDNANHKQEQQQPEQPQQGQPEQPIIGAGEQQGGL